MSSEGKATPAMMAVNSLDYSKPSASSLVNERRQVKYYPEQRTFRPNETMRVNIPMEGHAIYGPNCYLIFKLNVPQLTRGTAPANARLSATSTSRKTAYNLVRDCRITTLSGAELDFTARLNEIIAMQLKYRCQQDFMHSTGNLFLHNVEQGDGKTTNPLDDRIVIMPLHALSGFFNSKKMLPPQLGGIRLEIVWESAEKAFVWGVPTDGALTQNASYTINDTAVVVDAYKYTDEVMQKLNVASSNGALFLPFYSWSHHSKALTSTRNSIDVNESVGQMSMAMARVRLSANDNNADADSFSGKAYGPSEFKYRWRLGALHIPNHQVETSVEAYANALYAVNVLSDCVRPPSVSLSEFETEEHVIPLELERSNAVGMTGQPTNNSRQLNLNIETTGSLDNHDLILGVEYLKVAMIGLNGDVKVVQ